MSTPVSTPTPHDALRVLVVAKAPVAGKVKTRLGADIGDDAAAEVAAAALLDTLDACTEAVGPERCVLSLEGDLTAAVRADELADALQGWQVQPQRGDGFDERLAHAHTDAGDGPLLQIGMDTPQVTAALLHEAAVALSGHDVVLGPADDGGWWVLARREASAAQALLGVATSTPTTYDDTVAALEGRDLGVATTTALRDVDTVADAEAVAALVPPGNRFARTWSERGARR